MTSVNSKTGAVSLTAGDVGARPASWTPTAADVGADPVNTATTKVTDHNTSTVSHTDLRDEIKTLANRLAAVLDSDDTTLDELSEIVAYIKSNKTLIDSITTSKVGVADIIDNLTTNVANKPLSAAQGVALKTLIDGLQSGKLDAAALTSAINTALAQAEASGAFKGDKGDKGDSGVYVGSGDMPEGYNVQIDPDGEAIDLYEMLSKKVDKAKVSLGIASDGLIYVFVDGVPVGTGIPQGQSGDVIGILDENNNILLTGNLADGTYTLKYENTDGSYTDIGALKVGGVVEPITVNIPLTDGIRISSSDGGDRDQSGCCATGWIDLTNVPRPCTIHLSGVRWASASGTTGYHSFVCSFAKNASGTKIEGKYTSPDNTSMKIVCNNDNFSDVTVTIVSTDVASVRFSGAYATANSQNVYGVGSYATAKATLTYMPES